MLAIEHQTGNLIRRKHRGQIFRPLLHRQPPVLIRIKLSVPVQILERITVAEKKSYP